MIRYLTLAALLSFDLFVIACLDGPRTTKGLKQSGMGHANAWMLTPAVFFVLKLLSNSAFIMFGKDISKDAQGYFFLSTLFCFSLIFLGLAIGSSVGKNQWTSSLVVVFFGTLFTVSFLFFLFCLLLAFDESWNNWRF